MKVKIFNKSKCYALVAVSNLCGNCKCWYAEPNLHVFLYQPYTVYYFYCIRYCMVYNILERWVLNS